MSLLLTDDTTPFLYRNYQMYSVSESLEDTIRHIEMFLNESKPSVPTGIQIDVMGHFQIFSGIFVENDLDEMYVFVWHTLTHRAYVFKFNLEMMDRLSKTQTSPLIVQNNNFSETEPTWRKHRYHSFINDFFSLLLIKQNTKVNIADIRSVLIAINSDRHYVCDAYEYIGDFLGYHNEIIPSVRWLQDNNDERMELPHDWKTLFDDLEKNVAFCEWAFKGPSEELNTTYLTQTHGCSKWNIHLRKFSFSFQSYTVMITMKGIWLKHPENNYRLVGRFAGVDYN